MKTYSGINCLQDIFALYINSDTDKGFVVDIGCKTPGKGSNSTLFLEKGWSGVGADLSDYTSLWAEYKNYNFYNIDVTIKNNIDILFSGCPNVIEFLSLDVDEAGLLALKNIDLNKFKFKCICIEHDYYRFGESLRRPQREILDKKYSRVVQTQAEDWYVDYSLLDENMINNLKNIPKHSELHEHEMIKILKWLNLIK